MFNSHSNLEQALRFSRFDDTNPLSTISAHGFVLEGVTWRSAEHCYQAQKFSHNPSYSAEIASALTPRQAYQLGNRWWRRKRPDFQQVRRVLMTRALYCKAQQNSAIADYLLASGDKTIVEMSLYDHYWGIGRDLRGSNTLGEVWMDIRRKLREVHTERATT